jgi:cytochrome bd-type quinol oxidase subunit 1
VSTVDLARLQFASTSIYHFLRQHLTRGRARRRGPG